MMREKHQQNYVALGFLIGGISLGLLRELNQDINIPSIHLTGDNSCGKSTCVFDIGRTFPFIMKSGKKKRASFENTFYSAAQLNSEMSNTLPVILDRSLPFKELGPIIDNHHIGTLIVSNIF